MSAPHHTALLALRQAPTGPRATARLPLERAGPPKDREPARSLYIHVPFCFHKCHYCDFYSIVDSRDRQGAFVARLERELRALAPWGGALETIFVGGGTPTLLRLEVWERLLETLRGVFDLSAMRDAGCGKGRGEFTVECNPETATAELMGVLAAGGVNRLSVGAQSFDSRHLKTLERWHEPASVARAVDLARGAGIRRLNVDLIFGVPGQTLDEWQRDLEAALALGTDHVSCYNLTYEPGTAMTRRLRRGEFEPAPEEVEAEMYARTVATLCDAGLERYEVSNYARAGEECRHNLAYWRQRDWLAAGPSASAHVAGHRWKNTPRLETYLEADDDGFAPTVDHEPPDAGRALAERIMTGLRLREGIDGGRLLDDASRLGERAAERLVAAWERVVERGWGDPSARGGERPQDGWAPGRPTLGSWRLTDAGFLFADRVAADLMACIPRAGV